MRTLTRGDALRCAQRLPLAIIFRAFGAVWSTSLCLLCLMWLVFFDPECGWGDDGAGFGVVVVVEDGGSGFCIQTETWPKFEIEARATSLGPEIDDYAIGQHVVLVDDPT